MNKLFKRSILILLTLALVFVFTGCASKEADQPKGDNQVKEPEPEKKVEYAQGVTDETVTIGTIGVQSGPYAVIGTPYFSGMEAYFKMVNDNGGVNGREIKLIKKDDEFKADKSVQMVEALIFDEKAFAIVGHLGTPGVMASEQIVKEEGIPSVYFGAGAVALTKAGENFFPVQPNYVYEGKLMAKYAIDEFDAKKIAVIYRNDDVGRDGLAGVEEGLSVLGKSDILPADGKLPVNVGETDFTVQVQKAKSLNPDLVIIYGLLGEASGTLKEMEKVGFEVPMITTYSNADASFLAVASPGAPNVIKNLYVMGWLDVNEASLKPLVDAMAKYFEGVSVNAFTMAGWVAAETFVAGLEQAGDNLSWEGYIDAMNNLKFTTGLAPEISYSKGVREGVTMMALSKVVVGTDGTYSFELATDFNEFK